MKIITATEPEIREIIKDEMRELLNLFFQATSVPAVRAPANKKEVALYLGISESTLNSLLKVNAIPFFTIGRQVRFKWCDVEAYVNGKGN